MVKTKNKEKGFTLIEIAIVLTIITLLVGGILKGQELITNTKIKNISKDMLSIQTAFNAYTDRMGKPPVPKEESIIQIFPHPDLLFWENLRKEGFIKKSDYIGGGGLFTGPQHSFEGQFIFFGTMNPLIPNDDNHYLCAYTIPVKYSRGIDLTLDDGSPSTGRIKALQAPSFSGANNYDDFPSQETELFLCMSMT